MFQPKGMIRCNSAMRGEEVLPREFSLLSWNVHKQNLGIRFNTYFQELLRRHPIDIVALQEVKINPNNRHFFDDFHFSFAPNIQFFNHVYGVLNGSRVREIETYTLLSSHRETLVQTHKSTVFTTYALPQGETLLLANLHAINFRTARVYNREVDAIMDKVRHHDGAMIVTGDFNSWNAKRMDAVSRWMEELGLQSVEMDRDHLIRSFMRHKLDHIFYRGLKLTESYVIDVERLSDHNALYARFECK